MLKRSLLVGASLWVFWTILADQFDLYHTLIGLPLSAFVTIIAYLTIEHKWLFPIEWKYKIPWRLAVYYLRRIGDIILANIDLAERLLDPQLPINPAVIRLKHNLKNPVARTFLANSITIIPGTLTVEISEREVYIHFLAEEYLDHLLSIDLNRQIKYALAMEEDDK